jgi:hypothetical protein
VALCGIKLPGMAALDILTDKATKAAIRTACDAGKVRRLSDGGGLYIEARPTGAGWWRLRYRMDSREGMLSLGTYPDVTLKTARCPARRGPGAGRRRQARPRHLRACGPRLGREGALGDGALVS